MKKITNYSLLLLLVVLFASCGTEKKDAEIAQLKAINDSLFQVNNSQEKAIVEFVDGFVLIQDNLKLIRKKEGLIDINSASNVEKKVDAREQVIQDIRDIYQLLQENKNKLAELKKANSNSNNTNSELNRMIVALQEEIKFKDEEILVLKRKLESRNYLISGLESMISQMEQNLNNQTYIIDSQDISLHTAWYRIATKKELRNQKIINRKGKLLSIDSVNNELFIKVNTKNISSIPLFTKKAVLVSSHPENSYKYCGEKKWVDSIQILDYEKFWSVSNYCVIEVKY